MDKVIPLFDQPKIQHREESDWTVLRTSLKNLAPHQGPMIDYLVSALSETQSSLTHQEVGRDVALITTMVLDPTGPLRKPRTGHLA